MPPELEDQNLRCTPSRLDAAWAQVVYSTTEGLFVEHLWPQSSFTVDRQIWVQNGENEIADPMVFAVTIGLPGVETDGRTRLC